MSTPATLKEERFLGLPKQAHAGVLGDDYTHKKLETIKFKGTTTNGAKVDYKSVVALTEKAGVPPAFALTDELKLGIPAFENKYYYQFKVDRKGQLKHHIDLGSFTFANLKINPYVQFKSNLSFQNLWSRAGIFYFSDRAQCAVRVERDAKGEDFATFRHVTT